MNAFFQASYLIVNACSSINSKDFKLACKSCIISQIACDLKTQFPGRAKYQSLSIVYFSVCCLNECQPKSCCFASPGLSQGYNIHLTAQHKWNNFFLHGHWAFKTKLLNRLQNAGSESHLFKIYHYFIL